MNIEELKKKAREENIETLRNEINKKWVEDKIKKYLERHSYLNYTVESIKEQILQSDLIASFFIKEPSRQNFSEKTIANIISRMEKVQNFKDYPSNVNKFVVNGKITNVRVDGIKSIDYSWITNGKQIYATQKYTDGSGGAQDNQYNDVIEFLHNAAMSSEYSETVFFAIVDGNYYSEELLNYMRDKYERKNIKICRTEELEKYLEQI